MDSGGGSFKSSSAWEFVAALRQITRLLFLWSGHISAAGYSDEQNLDVGDGGATESTINYYRYRPLEFVYRLRNASGKAGDAPNRPLCDAREGMSVRFLCCPLKMVCERQSSEVTCMVGEDDLKICINKIVSYLQIHERSVSLEFRKKSRQFNAYCVFA